MRHVRRWALNEIVTPKQPAERAVALGQLIRIAQLACEARNFEVAIAILEALAYDPCRTLWTRGRGQGAKLAQREELCAGRGGGQDAGRGPAKGVVELRASQDDPGAAARRARARSRCAGATHDAPRGCAVFASHNACRRWPNCSRCCSRPTATRRCAPPWPRCSTTRPCRCGRRPPPREQLLRRRPSKTDGAATLGTGRAWALAIPGTAAGGPCVRQRQLRHGRRCPVRAGPQVWPAAACRPALGQWAHAPMDLPNGAGTGCTSWSRTTLPRRSGCPSTTSPTSRCSTTCSPASSSPKPSPLRCVADAPASGLARSLADPAAPVCVSPFPRPPELCS